MTMGVCPDALNHEQKSLLLSAADELIEMVIDDMKSVRLGKKFIDTNMPFYLPPQFSRHYTIPFIKRLLDTAIVVGWKIEHYHHWMASNMAEEMLLWRMLRLAEAFGAEQSIEFDAGDLADLMLEDTDFLLLFDRSLDGIEYQTDTTLKHLGIPSLRPENWFDPYDDSRLWWEEND
jgi:hypothetical protein